MTPQLLDLVQMVVVVQQLHGSRSRSGIAALFVFFFLLVPLSSVSLLLGKVGSDFSWRQNSSSALTVPSSITIRSLQTIQSLAAGPVLPCSGLASRCPV